MELSDSEVQQHLADLVRHQSWNVLEQALREHSELYQEAMLGAADWVAFCEARATKNYIDDLLALFEELK